MTTAASVKEDQLLSAKLCEYYASATEDEARQDLAEKYGTVWNDAELLSEFAASVFEAGPVLRVIRKVDGVRGTVAYVDKPRLYFAFEPDTITAEN